MILTTDTLSIPIRNDGVLVDLPLHQENLTFDDKPLIFLPDFISAAISGMNYMAAAWRHQHLLNYFSRERLIRIILLALYRTYIL